MVAGSKGGLQRIMHSLNAIEEKYEMKINIRKTKVMKVSRRTEESVKIQKKRIKIEQVPSFKHLGSFLTTGGRYETEIKIKIAFVKEHSVKGVSC